MANFNKFLDQSLDASKLRLDALSQRAGEIETNLYGIQSTLSARRVADASGLEKDLRMEFAGRHIVFKSYAGLSNDEPFWLCEQLVEIAAKAGVNPENKCATEPIGAIPMTNLLIEAPNMEEGQLLTSILKKERVLNGWAVGRVTGWSVELLTNPELIVMVGVRPSIPLLPKRRVRNTIVPSKPKANP